MSFPQMCIDNNGQRLADVIFRTNRRLPCNSIFVNKQVSIRDTLFVLLAFQNVAGFSGSPYTDTRVIEEMLYYRLAMTRLSQRSNFANASLQACGGKRRNAIKGRLRFR